MASFEGQVVVVTGSSSGIGAATAEHFARLGARVIVTSRASVEAGQRLAASLPEAVYVRADVGDERGAAEVVDAALDSFGRLDVVVNCAGTTELIAHDDLDAVTAEVWRRILDVNLIAPWNVIKRALPHLRAHGGAVVNVSSMAGTRPGGSSVPYAVSKAALDHMTRLLARVLGPDVRLNSIAPGVVETPWTEGWPGLHRSTEQAAPLRRSGRAEEIAEVIVAAAGATYMTGQVILVDGGLSLVTGVEIEE